MRIAFAVTDEAKLVSYKFNGQEKIEKVWDMQVPQVMDFSGYITQGSPFDSYTLFSDRRKIHVIFGDGQKPITYVKSAEFHRKMDAKTRIPQSIYFEANLGSYRYIFDKKRDKITFQSSGNRLELEI